MKTILISDRKDIINGHPIAQLNPKVISNNDLMQGSNLKLSDYDLIIDTIFEQHAYRMEEYDDLKKKNVLLLSCPTETLHNIFHEYNSESKATIFGFNGLPYFFSQNLWEISSLNPDNNDKLAGMLAPTGLSIRFVKDQYGMVAFRTIATIINEAFFMLQEGSATAQDIDQAMKLGVNYPKGPFEWANEIGIDHVYELLNRLRSSVSAETYKIAPALHRAYQKTLLEHPKM